MFSTTPILCSVCWITTSLHFFTI
uniref:Uncharacterized protein n=1 Tax=Arundo donax TaxID=35708 RepID=A0A0A9GWP3_ARUDO